MYQLSRLLHDYHRDLYSHLEQQEIGPSLYATPWFLTAFASHFPLGFVARVFGKRTRTHFVYFFLRRCSDVGGKHGHGNVSFLTKGIEEGRESKETMTEGLGKTREGNRRL